MCLLWTFWVLKENKNVYLGLNCYCLSSPSKVKKKKKTQLMEVLDIIVELKVNCLFSQRFLISYQTRAYTLCTIQFYLIKFQVVLEYTWLVKTASQCVLKLRIRCSIRFLETHWEILVWQQSWQCRQRHLAWSRFSVVYIKLRSSMYEWIILM